MPALDRYHNVVKRALIKGGWTIVREQELLTLSKRKLRIDIRARNLQSGNIALLEIKGFENIRSPIAYLQATLGQYLMYRSILRAQNASTQLYLAVTQTAYNGILREALSELLIEDFAIKIMVFDPETEEIVKWIPEL